MPFESIAVFGSGTMGHGIAQVCAAAGFPTVLYDIDAARVDAALAKVRDNLDQGVARGKVAAEEREAALANLSGTADLETAADGAELLIEAIPENLDWKRELFAKIEPLADPSAIFATNTSSLSIARISEALSDPSRLIGTHFFNPVHIMKLLEIVYLPGTDNNVIDGIRAWAERIGKECILVKDSPGFATSRLGVALGMEAIRMLQEGVASAEDIDKAMVMGYRHPVGPLRLTDMVGLDVRLAIGEYLSKELKNPAFEPPALLRKLVGEGKLGQKTGEGFYRWS